MTQPATDLDKILGKVRGLIEKADHPSTPKVEADACRARAESMMLKYAIEEAELDKSRPAAFQSKPISKRIILCAGDHPAKQAIVDLTMSLATHCRCEVVYHYFKQKYIHCEVTAFGFESDLRYLEIMLTSLLLHMSGELEPSPDPEKSFDENIYVLHEAGVKWERIASLMNRAYERMISGEQSASDGAVSGWRKSVRPSKDPAQKVLLVPWPDGHRLINTYRRYCREIGEEPRAIVSPVTYQRSFADGYVSRVNRRLWEMRSANAAIGTALVRRTEDVKSAVNEMFPDLSTLKRKEQRTDWAGEAAGRCAGDRADLSGGTGKVSSKRGELA